MVVIQKKANCCGCMACAQACPKKCIKMQTDREGFWYPEVRQKNCIQCGLCERVCPMLSGAVEDGNAKPICYAAMNMDEEIRLASSSGGIFTMLAQEVLERGGLVYGVAMTEDFRHAKHIAVENEQDLGKLRSSKYLQSEIGNTYCEVKKGLEKGRQVLFTGTPCQIEGLRTFLHKDYDNLLCMDIICHGVPSPKVWQRYLDYREKIAHASVQRIFFRDKKHGWKTYTVLFEFSNNTVYEQVRTKDLFGRAFLQNICLRPSCYNCHFKKVNRVSDITIGDFWGIGKVAPEMDDDKGTSLVLVHSDKGRIIFDTLKRKLKCKEVDCQIGVRRNPAMTVSSKPAVRRQAFFEGLDSQPFDVLVKHYAKPKRTLREVLSQALCKIRLYGKMKKNNWEL